MTVGGVLPAVARDAVRATDAARREDDRLRAKHLEASALAIVREGTTHAVAILEQRHDRALHVHVDAAVNRVILKCPDHFQSGPVTDVREPGIPMPAEVALENTA